jgi:hypothetical protein
MMKKETVIIFAFDEGKQIRIRKSMITAISGDEKGTTIYVHGNSFSVKNPLNEITALLNQSTSTSLTAWFRWLLNAVLGRRAAFS